MLHAVIRSEMTTIHFFSEVNHPNLDALRDYVSDTAAAEGCVWLRMEVDKQDESAFRKHVKQWVRTKTVAKGEFEGVVVC